MPHLVPYDHTFHTLCFCLSTLRTLLDWLKHFGTLCVVNMLKCCLCSHKNTYLIVIAINACKWYCDRESFVNYTHRLNFIQHNVILEYTVCTNKTLFILIMSEKRHYFYYITLNYWVTTLWKTGSVTIKTVNTVNNKNLNILTIISMQVENIIVYIHKMHKKILNK